MVESDRTPINQRSPKRILTQRESEPPALGRSQSTSPQRTVGKTTATSSPIRNCVRRRWPSCAGAVVNTEVEFWWQARPPRPEPLVARVDVAVSPPNNSRDQRPRPTSRVRVCENFECACARQSAYDPSRPLRRESRLCYCGLGHMGPEIFLRNLWRRCAPIRERCKWSKEAAPESAARGAVPVPVPHA